MIRKRQGVVSRRKDEKMETDIEGNCRGKGRREGEKNKRVMKKVKDR